jgi:spore coat protein U-like protein
MNRIVLVSLLLAGPAFCALTASGETLGGRMDVTAYVVANCRLTVPPLRFGNYDPLAAHATNPADASVDVVLNCTRDTTASVSFDRGLHGDATTRGLNGSTLNVLHYQIYRDPARSQVWGDGAEAMRVIMRGISTPEQLTVFGRIPPSQEVEPGPYTDVLTATVDF